MIFNISITNSIAKKLREANVMILMENIMNCTAKKLRIFSIKVVTQILIL